MTHLVVNQGLVFIAIFTIFDKTVEMVLISNIVRLIVLLNHQFIDRKFHMNIVVIVLAEP